MSNLLTTTRDLLRRLSPTEVSENVARITTLVPDLTEDLLSSVDQPLRVRRCKKSGRDFLLCDYNRDGDSYRSPWSNEFDPPLDDGTVPSERVRKLEVEANAAFDVYRELYYEGGVGSVYFWDLDDGFAGVVLLKKSVSPGSKSSGAWDSIHVFEATDRARTSHYKLTSTVILHLAREGETLGEMNLSGNMTRQIEVDLPVENDQGHVVNIGRLVEDMELKMRNLLQEVYFGKAKDVVGDLRSEFTHGKVVSKHAYTYHRYSTVDGNEQRQGGTPGHYQFYGHMKQNRKPRHNPSAGVLQQCCSSTRTRLVQE